MPRRDGPANRARILDALTQDPGLNVAELAERVGLSWHTTAYHLGILQRTRVVVLEDRGRDRRAFPQGMRATERNRLAMLHEPLARELLRLLLESRPQTIPGLAGRLGCPKKAVQRRLAQLVEGGLVDRIGAWRPSFCVTRAEVGPLTRLLVTPAMGAGSTPRPPPTARLGWTAVQADLGKGPRFGTWEWLPLADSVVMSDAAWSILGSSRQPSGTSRSFLRHVHPDDLPGFEGVVAKALTEGESYDHTVRIIAGGSERMVRYRGNVTAKDERGRPLRIAGTVEDVSATPAAARLLRQSTAALPASAGTAPLGALAWALDRLARTSRAVVRAVSLAWTRAGPAAPARRRRMATVEGQRAQFGGDREPSKVS